MDTLQNKGVKPHWEKLKQMATLELESTLAELALPLRKQAEKLPVILEGIPNAEIQADGVDVETLGLFVGAEFAETCGAVLPSQIILFLDNVWFFAGEDEKKFREEIRITFLHELGHFFGLDEDDLTARGLE